MRKLVFAIMAIAAFQLSSAQVAEGDILLSLGVGVSPTFYSGGGFESGVPPVEFQGEYGVTDKITVGASLGYASAEFRSGGSGFDYTYLILGALGNYHFVNNESWDVYAGPKLGYLSISADQVGGNGFGGGAEASGILFGAQAGARYWFSEKFGANAELGYGVAALKIGVTLKL